MSNFFGHFMTVSRHKTMVLKHCIKCGITFRGIMHDLSKFSLEEFLPGIKFYQGTKSPNEAERELYGYSKAWMHHKGRNKHHFEYWTDYNPKTKKMEAVKMPVVYVAEMFCDRVAASKVYMKDSYRNDAPLKYFQKGKNRRIIHEQTSALLEKLLIMLAQEGEEETFKYLKEVVKKGY